MGVGCSGKRYEALHWAWGVRVSATKRYIGVGCPDKRYEALHWGGVSR